MDRDGVGPTGDRHWHIKKQSIPRYNKEDLGNVPFLPPDVLRFLIEEDKPVVRLVIGGGRDMNDREQWLEIHKRNGTEGPTISVTMDT